MSEILVKIIHRLKVAKYLKNSSLLVDKTNKVCHIKGIPA